MSGNATREGTTKLQDIAFVAIANASGRPENYTQVYNYGGQADITECTISWCAKFYSNLKLMNGIMDSYTMEEKGFSSEEYHESYPDNAEDPLEQCYDGYGNVTFGATREEESYSFDVGCGKASGVAKYFLDLFKFQVSSDETAFASGQLLMNSESIPATMDAITEAFSIYLMASALNTTRHYGEAFYPEVFVVIYWQWLLFPAFLTILGACFLGTSLWKSWKHRESFLWKDSLVALLFHGLSKRGNNDEEPIEKTEMDEQAGLITAKPKIDRDEVYPNDKMKMDERAEAIKAKLKMDDDRSLKFIRA
ncbi:uncharacterized protein LTHEOB_10068 [Lasiodiplodia theobromae]|uniref:uncharacterized protein n=1 Tax=Lasiodiplodia theobromae TaxID=45133 RepID=UPI0015C3E4A9|nr:uncharacterized protein LTHEOB_10068 [Lasiodiplodia theobromae]KAF4539679.1 hypothetical protein LTHEOB_10068 [Lasiodiplodia theobromae]